MKAALPFALLLVLAACGEGEQSPAATSAAPEPVVNESADGPANSFAVCPGDPRCPKS